MEDNKQEVKAPQAPANKPAGKPGFGGQHNRGGGQNRGGGGRGGYGGGRRDERADSEYEQQILDLARVTRVMAGGKRMRFRACIVLGNKAGKVGIGLAKGADVTLAITKAVNQAKKNMIDVPIAAGGTIPHEIKHKFGASVILLRPAKHGRGVICGGVMRIIAEMAGLQNVTGKILGTNNNVTNAKCMIEALSLLKGKKVSKKAEPKEEAIKIKEIEPEIIAKIAKVNPEEEALAN
jgi:small subunit ribosomal protein S5